MIMHKDDLCYAAKKELERARRIHPPKNDIIHGAALVLEEAGEFIKAANDLSEKRGSVEELRKELIQTVAMCMRFAEDTDPGGKS